MGPAQHEKFKELLLAEALKPTTPQDQAEAIKKIYSDVPATRAGKRRQRRAQRHLETQAAHAIEARATELGVTTEELDAMETADIGAILPPGWFQAVIAALPQILAFVTAIAKLFGLGVIMVAAMLLWLSGLMA